jgi:prolyl-tRNA synthetase
MRDLEQGQIEVARRDTKEKIFQPIEGIDQYVADLLEAIQQNMFQRALDYRNSHITPVDTIEEFEKVLEEKGGFISAHWDGTTETELKIKERTKATIRCIPLDAQAEDGKCVLTGAPSQQRVLFALAY